MGRELFFPVKTAACVSDSVLVGLSCGKDSIVSLDLCCRYFKHVVPFYMYLVPGLSFHEAMIRFVENKYGVEVIRIPHPMLSSWLKWGVFRKDNLSLPEISFNDVYHYLRLTTGIWWIAGGERIADSIVRRAMMKRSGSIDEKRGRFYPISHFTKKDVLAYIKARRLKLSPEYDVMGYSFRGIEPHDMVKIRERFPADFETIKRFFPFVEAGCYKYERDQQDQASKI